MPPRKVTKIVFDEDDSKPVKDEKPNVKKETKPKKELPKKLSVMEKVLQKIGLNETFTKKIYYKFPKIKNHVFPQHGYNYGADLLELPTTKNKYNALLVCVDLYSKYFDIEPLKSKSSEEVLKAFKAIFKRGILPMPEATIRTDSGSEFLSVVKNYFYENSILHRRALPYRHKQNATVESLNRALGRLFMTYLTNKSMELGHEYHEWTDILETVRDVLNEEKRHPKDIDIAEKYMPQPLDMTNEPKYKVGDLVYRRLEKPENDAGQKYLTSKFRAGDRRYHKETRKVVKVLAYSGQDPWRYILNDLPNVSYAENELLPAKEKDQETYIIENIRGKRKIDGKIHYLVKWKGYLVKDATWEPEDKLLEDGASEYIQKYEQFLNDKKKK
jgi:hypothetical protein